MSDSIFEKFGKIPRFNRPIVVTEKIDGTNSQICIVHKLDCELEGWPMDKAMVCSVGLETFIFAGSRNRFITPDDDHYGFAKWVLTNSSDLANLGPGRHHGEWWGKGIQRDYGLDEQRFSLFNVGRWATDPNYGDPDFTEPPVCCHVVPIITGAPKFNTRVIADALTWLKLKGSAAAPGFDNPEGIVIYHSAADSLFKVTLEKDDEWKGKQS